MRPPKPVVGIYHRHKDQFLSALKTAVHLTSQYEVLPELIEIFEDRVFEFLEIFSGRTIRVPTQREVADKLRDVTIWVALQNATSAEEQKDLEARLSAQFKLRQMDIRDIFNEMKTITSNLAMEVRRKPE